MNEWIIVFAPATATLLGAYLGAKIAGEEAVTVVEKQIQYDKTSKEFITFDNEIKLGGVLQSLYITLLDDLLGLKGILEKVEKGSLAEGKDIRIFEVKYRKYLENINVTKQMMSNLNLSQLSHNSAINVIETVKSINTSEGLYYLKDISFDEILSIPNSFLTDIISSISLCIRNSEIYYNQFGTHHDELTEKRNELLRKITIDESEQI